jgi:hypothetical protein
MTTQALHLSPLVDTAWMPLDGSLVIVHMAIGKQSLVASLAIFDRLTVNHAHNPRVLKSGFVAIWTAFNNDGSHAGLAMSKKPKSPSISAWRSNTYKPYYHSELKSLSRPARPASATLRFSEGIFQVGIRPKYGHGCISWRSIATHATY